MISKLLGEEAEEEEEVPVETPEEEEKAMAEEESVVAVPEEEKPVVEEEKIEMTASYELMVNGAHCSDCDIKVTVEPRHSYRLCKETEEAPGNIDTKDAQ